MHLMATATSVVGSCVHLSSFVPALLCVFSSSQILSEQLVVLSLLSSHFLTRKWRLGGVRWLISDTLCGSLDSNRPPLLFSSVTKICAQCEMEHSADGLMEQMCSSDFGEYRAHAATAPIPPQPLLLSTYT